jgi:2-phosphosulfolactate phosphatase
MERTSAFSYPRRIMNVDVVLLPKDRTDDHVRGRAVVVFDVLRATTTMTAALAAGAKEIRAFRNLDDALTASRACSDPKLLCGEVRCLPPEGFDLGNSPGAYVDTTVRGKTLFMSTTNGTRAIAAAKEAKTLFVAALVNAAAAATALITSSLDVTLLCAGTDGAIALEDVLGAGAVIDEMIRQTSVELASDSAMIAHRLFQSSRSNLLEPLQSAAGGRNVIAAGLPDDVAFAARLNVFDIVGEVDPRQLIIRHL